MIGHHHRLGESFGLVIHPAEPDRVHIAPVFLGLRMDGRVAIDLTGGRQQEPRVLFLCQAQSLVCAKCAHFQGLDGHLQVIDRRCGRGEVQDQIQPARHMDEFGHILMEEMKLLMMHEVLDVPDTSGAEVVHAEHIPPVGDVAVAEMGAEESGPTQDQHPRFSHTTLSARR